MLTSCRAVDVDGKTCILITAQAIPRLIGLLLQRMGGSEGADLHESPECEESESRSDSECQDELSLELLDALDGNDMQDRMHVAWAAPACPTLGTWSEM